MSPAAPEGSSGLPAASSSRGQHFRFAHALRDDGDAIALLREARPLLAPELRLLVMSATLNLQPLLEQLPDLQGRVLKMRYGIGFEEPMSLSSIARELEMSRDRARSLERRAHEELRRLSQEMAGYLAA